MPRVLITGVDGFTGRYQAQVFGSAGYEVHGLVRDPVPDGIEGVSQMHVANLSDPAALAEVVKRARPEMVVHLAGIAFVQHGDVGAIYEVNFTGTRHLLEALSTAATPPDAVLLASSANVYGNATTGVLDESTPLAPANDYAVSKVAMEFVAKLHANRLPIIVGRPFNYTGVGQSESFLIPKIVSHVRRRLPVIELGNLDVARDFLDVRTVVEYYRRLLENPAARGGTFNICSGISYTLQQVLDMAREISGWDFEVRINPAFVRSSEVRSLCGNPTKLIGTVGPTAQPALRETLRWMIEAPAGRR
jgi:GDP-6-deoxy-D-talose 4-dehydrogenase